MDNQQPQQPQPMLLTELLEKYCLFNRRLRSPDTVRVYHIAIRQFGTAIGNDSPTTEDLTDENLIRLEKLMESRGRTYFTVNERTGRIKSLWSWAAKKRIVWEFPTVQRVPTPEPMRKAWSQEDLAKLFSAAARFPGSYDDVPCSHWWTAFLRLGFETGERGGPMLKLRWEWLDERGLDVPGEVRKAGKHAFYRISSQCRADLERIRLPQRELIFPWPLSSCNFFLHHKKLNKSAGLPTTRKDLCQRMRRTHLTWWRISGGNATERAQHSSSALTEKFYLDESLMPQMDPAEVLPEIHSPEPPKDALPGRYVRSDTPRAVRGGRRKKGETKDDK